MREINGLMMSEHIEIIKKVKYANGMSVCNIYAGTDGWTIVYPDGNTCYKASEASSKVNFHDALEMLSRNCYIAAGTLTVEDLEIVREEL